MTAGCQRLSKRIERFIRQAGHESSVCPSAAHGIMSAQNFELAVRALHARSITEGQIDARDRQRAAQLGRELGVVSENERV